MHTVAHILAHCIKWRNRSGCMMPLFTADIVPPVLIVRANDDDDEAVVVYNVDSRTNRSHESVRT